MFWVSPHPCKTFACYCSVAKLCPTLCDPMDCNIPGFPCSSLFPRVCLMSCPLNQWCHPTISSSVVPFSFCPQSFPASGSFPMSQFFASSGRSIGVSASASVLPMSTWGWFLLGLTGLIFLLSNGLKSLLQHHSSKTSILQHSASLLYGPTLTSVVNTGKNIALTRWTFELEIQLKHDGGTSLVVQWLQLCAPKAVGPGFDPWSGN